MITVIGAPIGLGMIQHSKFLLTPFSKLWENPPNFASLPENSLGAQPKSAKKVQATTIAACHVNHSSFE